ncbi:MAG: hypothetical protein ACRCWF_05525 [Beijerinckiaceae bacterium]
MLDADWRAKVAALLPYGDMDALDRLVANGRIIGSDGKPHPDLVAWVERGAEAPSP